MTSGAAAITSCGDTIRSFAAFCSQFGKHLLASGDLDEFRDPANAADERTVPLLEINLRLRSAANQLHHLAKASFIAPDKHFRLIRRSGQSADGADHRENAGDVTLIARMDGNAGADQLCRDRRLEIGKVRTRSGLSARIFGISAEVKAEKRGFSCRTWGGRTA
jgi:hypothetical protein